MYPKSLKDLINDFSKLPGIGEKTAERLVMFLATEKDNAMVEKFANNLILMKKTIKSCIICNAITDHELCDICSNTNRDHRTVMIVADSKDVFSLEQMKTYKGVYHVLGGLIDFSRGRTEKDINTDNLEAQAKSYAEIIIATNSTVEGELTAAYLKALLEKESILITRLAYGLPVGTDLKYADELTLNKAVENRRKY